MFFELKAVRGNLRDIKAIQCSIAADDCRVKISVLNATLALAKFHLLFILLTLATSTGDEQSPRL